MRVFGLNVGNLKNIKFEEAQSKNIVAVKMIRWGCRSTDLIQFFNENLIPLKMSLEGENCLIMKGLVFIEFDNFF